MGLGYAVKHYDTFDWDGDFKCVLKKKRECIAIYSPGDERGHLSDAIKYGKDNSCQLLVVPVRKGIRYNAPLNELDDNDAKEWLTLNSGCLEEELDLNENRLVCEIIQKIVRS